MIRRAAPGLLLALIAAIALPACSPRVRQPVNDARQGGPLPAQGEVTVAILNPRGVGRQLGVHRAPGQPPVVMLEQGAPDDQPLRDQRLELIKLVKLADGAVVGANVALTRRRLDADGNLRWQDAREAPTQVISTIHDTTGLTLAGNQTGYVLLVRSLDEDTGWRYLELDRTRVEDAMRTSLVIPDPMELPKVADHPDAKAWWTASAAAASAWRESERRR
jgi:hypothetical protein